mmetsp:Transcript_25247/g.77840  ORF Transcript_25247/g.77840 Transcript_25247/m.77840 type:complete len:229 (-) Transcript_25247:59-745(-)
MPTLHADRSCLERGMLVLQVLTACNRSQAGNFDLLGRAVLGSKPPVHVLATDFDLYVPVFAMRIPSNTCNSTIKFLLLAGVGHLVELHLEVLQLHSAPALDSCKPGKFDLLGRVILCTEETTWEPLSIDLCLDSPSFLFGLPEDTLHAALLISILDLDLALLQEARTEHSCIVECLRFGLLPALPCQHVPMYIKAPVFLDSSLPPRNIPSISYLVPTYAWHATLLTLD